MQPTGQSHNAIARWLVKLEGNPSELQQCPTWFPKGEEVYAFEEDSSVYLSGSVLRVLSSSLLRCLASVIVRPILLVYSVTP